MIIFYALAIIPLTLIILFITGMFNLTQTQIKEMSMAQIMRKGFIVIGGVILVCCVIIAPFALAIWGAIGLAKTLGT